MESTHDQEAVLENRYEPGTPVINKDTVVSKKDHNEVLLDNSEISEDDSAGEIFNYREEENV